MKVLGTDGLFLFSSLDTDQDMYISPEEFKPIAEKLTGTGEAGDSRALHTRWCLPTQPHHRHHYFLAGGCMGCFAPKPISIMVVNANTGISP